MGSAVGSWQSEVLTGQDLQGHPRILTSCDVSLSLATVACGDSRAEFKRGQPL